MKSRYKAVFSCGVVLLLFTLLFIFNGYNDTWQLWNVPTMSPHFADLRVITHGAESYEQGFDPMVNNPADPWQRPLNYPRIWQALYFLGVNQSHTTYLGIVIIFSFLAGVCLILPNVSNRILFLVFAAVLSPATLLGVERANNDLLIFFIVSLSVWAAKRSYLFSVYFILFGFLLKFYPIFGSSVLLGAGKNKYIRYGSVILIFALVYTSFYYSEMQLIYQATPRDTAISYGMHVAWMHIGSNDAYLGNLGKLMSYFFVFLIFGLSIFFQLFSRNQSTQLVVSHEYIDSFRAGAAIYIGTFLIGYNWDYRLIFLIFTIPQLVMWSGISCPRIAAISKIALVCIYVSVWHLLLYKMLGYLPYGNRTSYVIDEFSNWIVFGGLVYLLFWSSPLWARTANPSR